MPARVMVYDGLSYINQKKEEVLASISNTNKLAPVVTLIFNMSKEKWNGPRTIHEMISTSNKEILQYVPNYKINLISPVEMSDEEVEKFKTNVRCLIECRKYSEDKEGMQKIINSKEAYQNLDKETIQVINTHMDMHLKYKEEKEGGYNMCKAIDDMRADSRNEGKIEGLYEAGLTIEAIAESLGESIEKVSEVIDAYKEKYGDSEIKMCKAIEDMIEKSKWKVKIEGIQNMYKGGLTIELISKYLDVSIEKVREVLGIKVSVN